MDLNNAKIRETCADAVFERGRDYRDEGHIQRIERFGDVVTAAVRGTSLYDVTVDLGESTIDARCTCPYEGAGECKHVVAVLLDVVADPPQDESEHVERVIEDVSSDDLRAFVRDALAENPDLREQFLARFGDGGKSVEAYRDEIEELFNQHTQHYPVVTEAIDFSHFFEVAEQYRERECYRAAATVYRALFEGIDDNHTRIDAAYDHYAKALRSALEGYVDCVLAADPSDNEFERFAGALEAQAMSEPRINEEQFRRALGTLEDRR
ncbi:SWIM zinc finger family protein [Halalkaliarchaeum sp. AArc-GB]|uniref:SWIM zinc finger family protein n=1 Tax=Halalkaliarchaeum sp. AArc-GB TaxID=3074078 RepID=UPI0028595226|nr:SWIM zinc finger family protein [Halalkaliarchaeum sp. AArc-GB]MDR5673170.1 SWIM zinc finger family protein [Halalkaliarchaeum sp. AArc-GB]